MGERSCINWVLGVTGILGGLGLWGPPLDKARSSPVVGRSGHEARESRPPHGSYGNIEHAKVSLDIIGTHFLDPTEVRPMIGKAEVARQRRVALMR